MRALPNAHLLNAARPGMNPSRCERFCSLAVHPEHHEPASTIGVASQAAYQRLKRLFDSLEERFSASFEPRMLGDVSGLDGLILPEGTREHAVFAASSGVRCYAVVPPTRNSIIAGQGAIQFGNHPALCPVFHNQTLEDEDAARATCLPCDTGEHVLASRDGRPVWLHRQEAGRAIHLSGLELPALPAETFLSDYFNGKRFLSLLPLLHFLREVTEVWEAPPVRACFVFDDPNLRRLSYGYIQYPELAAHAAKHNYHTAIATIPLDARWADRRVASLFRTNAARLSLAIHGNEHTYLEMARLDGEASRLALLAAALRRVQELETRHGLSVCRVMEAPHAVMECSQSDGMIALGYEAVMVSTRLFLQYNRPRPCSLATGFGAAEWLPGGLARIPRIILSPHWRTEAMLAAFLRQPIVIAGHHCDARNDLAQLAEIATTINGFGPVEWCKLSRIARTNYLTRTNGEQMIVRAAGRRIAVSVPENVRSVLLERPWLNHGDLEPLEIRTPGGNRLLQPMCGASSAAIAVSAPGIMEFVSPAPNPLRPADAPIQRLRLWPIMRRAMTEFRDRAHPYVAPIFEHRPVRRQPRANSSS
jgi:hypothetical protein